VTLITNEAISDQTHKINYNIFAPIFKANIVIALTLAIVDARRWTVCIKVLVSDHIGENPGGDVHGAVVGPRPTQWDITRSEGGCWRGARWGWEDGRAAVCSKCAF
jgi:hypothetical protein